MGGTDRLGAWRGKDGRKKSAQVSLFLEGAPTAALTMDLRLQLFHLPKWTRRHPPESSQGLQSHTRAALLVPLVLRLLLSWTALLLLDQHASSHDYTIQPPVI